MTAPAKRKVTRAIRSKAIAFLEGFFIKYKINKTLKKIKIKLIMNFHNGTTFAFGVYNIQVIYEKTLMPYNNFSYY